ncbi:MAG: M13 family metallopeptidase, partial [Rhodothermaceae bacterium]
CKPTDTAPKGFDLNQLDKTVKPQDDFFHYSIGGWIKSNPIPEDKASWSGFNELREKTVSDVKQIIEKAATAKSQDKNSGVYKVGTFYNIALDSAKAENLGIKPIEGELERIDKIASMKDFVKEVVKMSKRTSNPLLNVFINSDPVNSNMNIGWLWQGGIGLGDRDYYFDETDRAKKVRAKYKVHVTNMLKLIGYSEKDAAKSAEAIFTLEESLAKISNTRTENRDPEKRTNRMTLAELKKMSKNFDWNLYFSELGVTDPGTINVAQPKFFKQFGAVVKKTSMNVLKDYLKWNLVRGMATELSSAFVNERFEFASKFMRGQPKIAVRWKRATDATSGALGELVGQLYVKKHFPEEAKVRANKIVQSLLVAMGDRIKGLEWMSAPTKEKALEKLSTFGVKIGYPDKWKDYSSLEISDDSYAMNVIRANEFAFAQEMKKLNKPIDPTEWGMNPQTVNAYYSPARNEIVFPAGILQFPFFDKDVDDAINYGAMGAVIGHEITHGFDDSGAKYNKDGNLEMWWAKEDFKKFEEKTAGLVKQYDDYAPFEGHNVNGKMTLGENIADLGGLTVSYEAFKKTEQFKKNEKIDGFTPAQRFFFGWAQVWKTNIRDEALKDQIKTDVHSPGMYRVIGPLANLPQFFEAFDVKEGDKMRRPKDKIVKIW